MEQQVCPELGKGYDQNELKCKSCIRSKECIEIMRVTASPVKSPNNVNFVPLPHWFLDDGFIKKDKDNPEMALTPSEFLALMIFARHASCKQGINQHGCRYGETVISNRDVAKTLGMSEASVDRLAASLGKKEHLVTVRQEYDGSRNKCIRLVSFLLEVREYDGGRSTP